MKTYSVEHNGKTLKLRGLENGVKEHISDIVCASELNRIQRLAKKKLIDGDVFLMAQQSASAIDFTHEKVVYFLNSEEGRRELARAIIVGDPSDADVSAIADAMTEADTPLGSTLAMIVADAYPKKAKEAESFPDSTDPA